MTDASVYSDSAIMAYHLMASMLSPGEPLAAWVGTHRPLEGQRVLDLGAGTGVSSHALADAGAQVVAVDASKASLDVLENGRGDRAVKGVEGDFRKIDLGSRFDVITLSRNTFFLAQSHDDKISLLRVIRHHLKPGGAAFIDCADPTEFYLNGGDAASVTYPLGSEHMVTITQTADRASQQVLSIVLVQGASTLVAFHEAATWASLQEIRLLARAAALDVTSVSGSYAGEEYDRRSREMLIVLEPL